MSSMLTRCQRDGFHSASGAEGSMAGKVTRSLACAVRRLRLNPISARPFRVVNRSVVNGIRYSACQPFGLAAHGEVPDPVPGGAERGVVRRVVADGPVVPLSSGRGAEGDGVLPVAEGVEQDVEEIARGVVVADHRAGTHAAFVRLPGVHHHVDRIGVVADARLGALGGVGAVRRQVDRHGQRRDGLPGRVVAAAVHPDLALDAGQRPDHVARRRGARGLLGPGRRTPRRRSATAFAVDMGPS